MFNKREEAIIGWVKKNRPDLLENITRILSNDRAFAALFLISCVAFEAGRQFQHDNPDVELDNPNVY